MDEERARRFWERALRDIRDDGFFAPVQIAEPPKPEVLRPPVRHSWRLTNIQLVFIVVTISIIVAVLVLSWLAPAFI